MKKTIALLLVLVMVFGLGSCAAKPEKVPEENETTTVNEENSSSTAEKESDTPYDLKLSGHPYIHALPSVYSVEEGFLSLKDGAVDMYAGGPVQNEAIASGAWDAGTTGTGGAVLGAVGYGLKVVGYACPDENTVDLWVRADSKLAKAKVDQNGIYGTAEDWRGLTILCPTGTSCHMTLIGTLNYLGLSEDDITLIDSSVADSYAAFKAGTADVVALWSPFGFQAEENEDWIKVASAVGIGLTLPCILVATEDAISNNWEAVLAYVKAYYKSAEWMNAHQKETASLLYDFEEEQGISMSESVSVLEVANRQFYSLDRNKELFAVDDKGSCEANDILLHFAEFFESQGKISAEDLAKLKADGMVDTSFIEAIVAGK